MQEKLSMQNFSDYLKSNTSAVFFLNTFQVPRLRNDYVILTMEEWSLLLSQDPQVVTTKLLEEGYLQQAGFYQHLDFKYTVVELKSFLEEKGLSTQGRKSDLITRLIHNDLSRVQEMLSTSSVLECSAKGKNLVNETLGNLPKKLIFEEQEATSLAPQKIKDLVTFTLGSVVGGIIGNRSDALLLLLYRLVIDTMDTNVDLQETHRQENIPIFDKNTFDLIRSLSRSGIVLLLSTFHNTSSWYVMKTESHDDGMIGLPNKILLNSIEELESYNLLELSFPVDEYCQLLQDIVEPKYLSQVVDSGKPIYRLTRNLTSTEEQILNNSYRITEKGKQVADWIINFVVAYFK